jgi:hypothetical protein
LPAHFLDFLVILEGCRAQGGRSGAQFGLPEERGFKNRIRINRIDEWRL